MNQEEWTTLLNKKPIYSKSYWRLDLETEEIQWAAEVADDAPVGVWIPALGLPYAYFETEDEAKLNLKNRFKHLMEYYKAKFEKM